MPITSPGNPQVEPAIIKTLDTLRALNELAVDIASDLDRIANRAEGSLPPSEAKDTAAAKCSRTGLIGNLMDISDQLSETLNSLSASTTRLSAII